MDIFTEDIADNLIATVWEPAVVKINALTAATEAACLLLSVDETIRNPTSNVVSYSLILFINCSFTICCLKDRILVFKAFVPISHNAGWRTGAAWRPPRDAVSPAGRSRCSWPRHDAPPIEPC